jgi:hypothetical protein
MASANQSNFFLVGQGFRRGQITSSQWCLRAASTSLPRDFIRAIARHPAVTFMETVERQLHAGGHAGLVKNPKKVVSDRSSSFIAF